MNAELQTSRLTRVLAHPATLPAIVLGLLVWRVWWHVVRSDLTLLEDEAHYWEWSRRLDWSYYSKGPGVAWLIAASTRLFGDVEWAVRVPGAVSSAIGILGAAAGARWAFPDQRSLVATSALLFALVPGFAIASMMMTIDTPYIACWMWAGAFAVRAIRDRSAWAWIAAGAVIAGGTLFKHTMLMALPALLLATLFTRGKRQQIPARPVLASLLVAGLGLIPMLVWNSQNDWANARHLLGHLGLPGGDVDPANGETWSPVWALEYLIVQAFVGGPVISLAFIGWLRVRRSGDDATRAAFAVFGSFAITMYGLYLIVSLLTQTEGNWAMAGAATLCPLAAWTVLDQSRSLGRIVRTLWWIAIVGGMLAVLVFPGMRFASERRVIGPSIPLYRFDGMRKHAEHAARLLDQIRTSTGREPFVMCDHYGRTSQLAFYLPDHPIVYCASVPLGGRSTQYDLWVETDLANPETRSRLLGRPALLIGGNDTPWSRGFEGVTRVGPLEGEPKPEGKSAFIADRFIGFPQPAPSTPAESD